MTIPVPSAHPPQASEALHSRAAPTRVDWQRTGVNTDCKWLLLRHAFEQLHANRVEFKTDSRNWRDPLKRDQAEC